MRRQIRDLDVQVLGMVNLELCEDVGELWKQYRSVFVGWLLELLMGRVFPSQFMGKGE